MAAAWAVKGDRIQNMIGLYVCQLEFLMGCFCTSRMLESSWIEFKSLCDSEARVVKEDSHCRCPTTWALQNPTSRMCGPAHSWKGDKDCINAGA